MLTPADSSAWTRDAAAHLLNRAGFGGSPADVDKLHTLGRERAVESLISGADDSAQFPPLEWTKPEAQRTLAKEMMESRQGMEDITDPAGREAMRRQTIQKVQRRQREETIELVGWWFNRMAGTPYPLREKMTLFWHGHFATSIEKVKQPGLMAQQNALFRRHALGSFRDLAKAIVEDPAMMIYLDTNNSNRERPNENFARELMELFTLGEGHYTEDDIKASARAFTGYNFRPFAPGTARFLPFRHDDGEKTFMGQTGRFRGEDIVRIILGQPQCAKFMSAKLWRFFVSDTPPDEAEHADLTEALTKAEWQLAPFLTTLFNSAAFYGTKAVRSQIKSPVQFLVQMRKQLELSEKVPHFLLAGALQQLGQIPFRPPNVAGWEGGRAWINTSTLLARYNISGALTTGNAAGLPMPQGPNGAPNPMIRRMMERRRQPAAGNLRPSWTTIVSTELRKDPAQLLDALAWRFFTAPLTPADRAKFETFAMEKAADGLSDDDLGHLAHLMMSTPQYQLC